MNLQYHAENQKSSLYPNRVLRRWAEKCRSARKVSDLRRLDLEVRKDESCSWLACVCWHKMIAIGQYRLSRFGGSRNINKSYLQRMMRLMLLSPRIIDAVLNGQPEGFALTDVEKAFSRSGLSKKEIWIRAKQSLNRCIQLHASCHTEVGITKVNLSLKSSENKDFKLMISSYK